MLHAIRDATPAFDYEAFAAASANLASGRHALRSVPQGAEGGGAPRLASTGVINAQARWVVRLHLAAARRWLACTPARPDDIEHSLRLIGAACHGIDPIQAAELMVGAHRLARGKDVEGVLCRIGSMLGAAA